MSYDALCESSPRYQTEDMLLPYFNQDNMFFNFPNSNVPHFQQLTKQTVDQFQFEASTRHTNKSSDNKFKKIKARVYKGLTRVINKRMKKIQKSTNYPKMAKFELFPTVPEIYANPNIKDNRIQINEPIKNLYSKCPISTAYKKYGEGHNIEIIEILENEPQFKEINDALNLTYLEILSIFRGDGNETGIIFLNKLKKEYQQFIKKLDKYGEKYINQIKDLVDNFEHYYR
jgi:arsenate reductase-like glutaredoxin family protein